MTNYFLVFALLLSMNSFSKEFLEGTSHYRIITVGDVDNEFDIHKDIRSPIDSDLAKEKVEEIVRRSLAPLLTGSGLSGKTEGSLQGNLLGKLHLLTSSLKGNILKEKVELTNNKNVLLTKAKEVNSVTYVLPYKQDHKDLYYSNDKVSFQLSKNIDIIKSGPSNDKFFEEVTEGIKELIKSRYEESIVPAFLLGVKIHTKVFPNRASGEKVQIVIDGIIGLKNIEMPMEPITNDQVSITGFQIPEPSSSDIKKAKAPVAKIKITVKDNTDPNMEIDFGVFEEFKKSSFQIGEFLVNTNKKEIAKNAPRLLAKPMIKGKAISILPIDLIINKLNINLKTQAVENIDMRLLLGLGTPKGKTIFKNPAFSFKKSGVDEQFKTEVNASITAAKEQALKDGEDKIAKSIEESLEGKVSDETVKLIGEALNQEITKRLGQGK